MNFLGSITAPPDPPGVDLDRWTGVIATHPNLELVAPKAGINPFTKGPFTFRPHPGTAWVMISGKQAGMMDWAQDGSNQIAVWGESDVEEIATHVAAQVGGVYRRGG